MRHSRAHTHTLQNAVGLLRMTQQNIIKYAVRILARHQDNQEHINTHAHAAGMCLIHPRRYRMIGRPHTVVHRYAAYMHACTRRARNTHARLARSRRNHSHASIVAYKAYSLAAHPNTTPTSYFQAKTHTSNCTTVEATSQSRPRTTAHVLKVAMVRSAHSRNAPTRTKQYAQHAHWTRQDEVPIVHTHILLTFTTCARTHIDLEHRAPHTSVGRAIPGERMHLRTQCRNAHTDGPGMPRKAQPGKRE